MHANWEVFLTAILIGMGFGIVLQRSGFSTTFAFWNLINFKKDFTMFRAYLLGLLIAILGANALEDLGWIVTVDSTGQIVKEELRRQAFLPIANIIGGYIFGLGTILTGGCACSVLYRCGEGFVNAWLTFTGFFISLVMTEHGWLKPLYDITGLGVEINGKENPALWDLWGDGLQQKWIIIGIVTLIMAVFIFRRAFSRKASEEEGCCWILTGIIIGMGVVAAWWASAYWGGIPRGLSFTGPTGEFFLAILTGDPMTEAPTFKFFGIFETTWSSWYILSVPLGAFISARFSKQFRVASPPASELVENFIGGLVMGVGAAIAGGCNIGHGLTGASTLAISSLVTITSMVLGTWTIFYLKVMRS